jgi:hypothetical protein
MQKLTEKPTKSGTRKKSKTPTTARGRKRSPANGHKTPAGRGAARLRDSINAMVSKQSDRIAQALIDKTVKGNMTGARILVELSGADKVPPEKKKKRSGPSWAELLASEPEWDPSMEENFNGEGAITVLEDGTIKRDASKLLPSEPAWPDEDDESGVARET